MPRESTVHRGARRVPLLRGKVQTSLRLGSAHSGFPCTVLALLGLPLPPPGEHAFPTQTCSPLTPELQRYLFQRSLEKCSAPGTSDPLLVGWGFFAWSATNLSVMEHYTQLSREKQCSATCWSQEVLLLLHLSLWSQEQAESLYLSYLKCYLQHNCFFQTIFFL